MVVGTGIAFAGVWVFAGLLCLSKTTTSKGVNLAITVAVAMTAFIFTVEATALLK